MSVPAIAYEAEPQRRTAVDAYYEEVQKLSGVLAVVRSESGLIRVHVADRRGPAGDAAYALEERINAEFPDEFVDVWVSEAPVPVR